MTRKLGLYLFGLFGFCFLVSCGSNGTGEAGTVADVEEEAVAEPVRQVEVLAYGGSGNEMVGLALGQAPSAGAERSMEYELRIETDLETFWQVFQEESYDMALVPTLEAVRHYHEADDIALVALVSYGGISLLERGETMHNLVDIEGKTIHGVGQGETPDFMLEKLLLTIGVDVDSVTIEWHSPLEMMELVGQGASGIFLVQEPLVRQLMSEGGLRQVVKLSTAWSDEVGGLMPVGGAVVRQSLLETEPEIVDLFVEDLRETVAYLNVGGTAQGRILAESDLVATTEIGQIVVAEKIFYFVAGVDLHSSLQPFFIHMFQGNPLSVGGGLPYDDFYYMGE